MKKLKFGIDAGHNCTFDTGATGWQGLQEDNLTKQIAQRLISKLQEAGHEAIYCTPVTARNTEHSLQQRCQFANQNKVNFFVSIHFNAFNKKVGGTEVFAVSDAGRKIARPVLAEIVKLGFKDRGVKNGSHLHVLKNTKMPGILVECCFIDFQEDMELFDLEKMVTALTSGLLAGIKQ